MKILLKSVYPERSGQLLSYYFRIKYKTDMSNIKHTAAGLINICNEYYLSTNSECE